MNSEYEAGRKIAQSLQQGLFDLDPTLTLRLATARQRALERQKIAVAGLGFAGVGHVVGDLLLPHARTLVAITGLTLGVIGVYYWNAFEQADENEEIDSALLAGELPVAAYTDQGFQAWLEHTSQSSEQ